MRAPEVALLPNAGARRSDNQQRLKPLLEELWKPWLDGRGSTRDEALAALVERAVAASR